VRVTRSVIPNLFTLANLFCGFTAIITTFSGKLEHAALFILMAGIFDALDGVIARLVHSTSEFGVELDSLCDTVSFGVAPAVMLWVVFFHEWLNWGLLLASAPALAAVLRLARFNIQLTSREDKLYFRGMPVPAAAFTIVSYIIFSHPAEVVPEQFKPAALVLVTCAVSLAMVSTIKFDNLPRPSIQQFRKRPAFFVVFFLIVIVAFITKGVSIFPSMLAYLAWGTIRHIITRFKRADDDDNDTIEEPDPNPFTL